MAETMKDSGQEWIGTIPESWDTNRIRYCLDEINVKNSPVKTEQILSLVKDKGVMLYEEKGDVGNKAKEDITGYKVAFPNTLIVNSMNILIGSVGISQYKGCVSPVYYVFREKDNSDLRFINYIFNTREFQKELRKYANGILEIRLRVSAADIFNRKMPLPSKEEQTKIADFLDEKCAEIDQLSEDIQKQIDILEEYKKSVITRAVTKGLNPNTDCNESSCKYIRKIPTNATMTRMKYITKLITDGTHQTPDYQDDGKPFLSIKDISSGFIDFSDTKYISEQEHKQIYSHAPVKKGDILFTRIGTLGVSVVVDTDKEFSIFVSLGLIKPDTSKIIPSFLSYVMSSNYYYDYIQEVKAGGGTHAAKFNLGDVAESPVIIYPIDDQLRIVDFLDRKCNEINESIQIKKEQLEKLDTYKRSIIYEYVTGKKRVA